MLTATENIILTAYVVSPNPHLVPTGIVVFACGKIALGVSKLDSDGMAILTIPASRLGAGDFELLAYYQGDRNFAPGVSVPTVKTVTYEL